MYFTKLDQVLNSGNSLAAFFSTLVPERELIKLNAEKVNLKIARIMDRCGNIYYLPSSRGRSISSTIQWVGDV